MAGYLSPRAVLAAGSAALALAAVPLADSAGQGAPLTIVSWGGVYTASQMVAYVEPYRETAERWVRVVDYTGGLEELREQHIARNVTWDVMDVSLGTAQRGCEEGLFAKIDHAILPGAPDGTPASDDFIERTLHDCAVGQNVFAVVVGYDTKAVGGKPPESIEAFFDIRAYPGKRGVQTNPRGILEWALIADGVAKDEVYEVLDTEDGIERAFDKLSTIAKEIVWWEDPATPPRLLANDRVVMTQTFNGRIQDAIDNGAEQAILWDAQLSDVELWAIPARSPNREVAEDFVAFASASERQAAQAREIAYGPVRASAMEMLDEGIRAKLPTAEGNAETAMWTDHAWWAENQERMERRFAQWRNRIEETHSPLSGTAR